jgi:hypothetical protein
LAHIAFEVAEFVELSSSAANRRAVAASPDSDTALSVFANAARSRLTAATAETTDSEGTRVLPCAMLRLLPVRGCPAVAPDVLRTHPRPPVGRMTEVPRLGRPDETTAPPARHQPGLHTGLPLAAQPVVLDAIATLRTGQLMGA